MVKAGWSGSLQSDQPNFESAMFDFLILPLLTSGPSAAMAGVQGLRTNAFDDGAPPGVPVDG